MYISKYFKIKEITEKGLFDINFGHKRLCFTFCQMLALRHQIRKYTQINYIEYLVENRNIEIISTCNNEHIFIFNIAQLLDLNKILNQVFFNNQFNLNSNSFLVINKN